MTFSISNILLVILGGSAGALTRYGANLFFVRFGSNFPLSTLVVNIVGSFLIGIVMGLFGKEQLSEGMRLAVVTGYLGALTTFSSFSFESISLLQTNPLFFAINVLGNVAGCLLATWLGLMVVKSY